MAETDRDRLLDHNYDGIQEYDNPLPRWWVWLFYATIAFSIVYGWYYHLGGPGLSKAERFEREYASYQARYQSVEAGSGVTEESIRALLSDQEALAAAREVYAAKCAPCHGQQGQGLIGPNLTDDYWIDTGGTLEGIYHVIRKGVPAKGMIAWEGQLSNETMAALAAFIASIHGSNPPGGKAPQGDKFEASW